MKNDVTQISNEIQISGEGIGCGGAYEMDVFLQLAVHPFAVAEIEIIDTIPCETYGKYELDGIGEMSWYVFYNAKVTNIYYADDNFTKNESENIVFKSGSDEESHNYTSGDKFICILVSCEESCGSDKYKNVYGSYFGSDNMFDIKNIDGTDYVIRKTDSPENLFDLDLSHSAKENIINKVGIVDEKYITYYDGFADALVGYIKAYNENE